MQGCREDSPEPREEALSSLLVCAVPVWWLCVAKPVSCVVTVANRNRAIPAPPSWRGAVCDDRKDKAAGGNRDYRDWTLLRESPLGEVTLKQSPFRTEVNVRTKMDLSYPWLADEEVEAAGTWVMAWRHRSHYNPKP